MNFDLGPDELALQGAIRDLCRGRFPLERLRAEGMTRDGWRALEEAGVFSLTTPQNDGGLGLGMTAAVVVFEELGRALIPGPVVGSLLAARPGSIVGLVERADPFVEHLDLLDALVVLDDEGGWGVEDLAGVEADPIERALDPLTPVHRIHALPQGAPVAEAPAAARRRHEATALTAAQLVGMAAATTEMAVAYAKERHQFGRPIGSFQAVKHLCADMHVRTEVARAAVHAAACLLDDDDPTAARATAAAKLLANDAGVANGKACIQVMGGMGFTWEVDAHLYLKRAALLARRSGDTRANEEAMAATL